MWVLALGSVALLTAPGQAQGQRGRGFGGRMAAGYTLLGNASVQKELKLDDSQAAKVTKVVTDVSAKMSEKLQDVPKEERRERMVQAGRESDREIKEAVKDVLKPEQRKRLDQIVWQRQGLMAFTDPAVATKMNLNEDQKSKIRAIGEEARGSFGGGGFNKDATTEERAEALRKMQATQKQSMEKAMAVLTDEQKKTWKELTGEPFEVRFERPQ